MTFQSDCECSGMCMKGEERYQYKELNIFLKQALKDQFLKAFDSLNSEWKSLNHKVSVAENQNKVLENECNIHRLKLVDTNTDIQHYQEQVADLQNQF